MRKGRLFRYLWAMIMALGTSANVLADDPVKVEFEFNCNKDNPALVETPDLLEVTTTANNFGYGSYDVYFFGKGYGNTVAENSTASVTFNNFKYEISEIVCQRHTNFMTAIASTATTIVDKYNKSYVVDGSKGTVDRNEPSGGTSLFSGSMSGLTSITIKNNQKNDLQNTYVVIRRFIISYYKPEIRIRFANGNKGYDMTVGDQNGQIEAYISDHAGAFVVGQDNVYFKYSSEDANIASIDSRTGKITPNSEGDVKITATLIQKVGNQECEINSYEYTLHVFARGEGMTWSRYETLFKSSASDNFGSYTFGGATPIAGVDWTVNEKLRAQATIWENEAKTESEGQYKQIAAFQAPAPTSKNWRAAVQKISCETLIPKYTQVESTLKFGANTTLGTESRSANITYGYEFVDLGIKTDANTSLAAASANADTRIREIQWNTVGTSESATSVGSYRTNGTNGITYLRNGANEYKKHDILTFFNNGEGYIGDHYDAGKYWSYDNSQSQDSYVETRFFAAMVFLQNQYNYSATASFGYQDIPTYEYYVYLDYYANYDDNKHLGREERSVKAKDATIHLNSGNVSFVPNRTGYKLLGWSTDKDAKTAEFPVNGDFYPYDSENGGGKGPVTLYAVWEPKTYLVALNPNGGTIPGAESGRSVTVNAIFGEPMPSKTKSGADVAVPYREGYKFEGYFTEKNGGTMYYDGNMQSVRNWDIDYVPGPGGPSYIYLYAHWVSVYTVTLDHNDGTGVTEQVTVANGYPMPSVTTTGAAVSTLERRGYIFDGYYERPEDWSEKKYYNADLTSAQSWDKDGSATIYAHWKMNPYTIIFHSNDSENKTASQEITNQYSGIYTSFERDGYTLTGWSYTPDGDVVFYKDQIIPSDDINISEPDRVLHLYAQWDLKNLNVTFNYTDPSTKTTISSKILDGYKLGSSNNSSLSGTIIETPNSDDYVFAGWFDKNENGSMVYDADGNAVEGSSELPGSYYWKKEGNEFVWNSTNDVNLYANWIRDMVSVDVKVIRDDNYENTDHNHRYVGVSVSGLTDIINLSGTNFSGYITVDGVNFLTSENPNGTDNLKSVSLDNAPIWNFRLRNQEIDKSIDEYIDLYTEEPLYDIYTVVNGITYYLGPKTKVVDGKKDVVESALAVYTSKPDFPFIIYGAGYVCYRPLESKIFNHVLSMIDNNTDWEFENTGRNPQYRPIRIITAGSSISSVSNLNAVKVIKEIKKKLTLPEYAYNVGKANVQETDDDLCNGLLYVDMGNAAKVIEAEKFADFKKETSKNCLLFMPSSYEHIASIGNNVVRKEGTGYKSVDNLVVTDKVPFSSPYTFNTGSYKASYSRETSDKWGSMCLPFPVKRSSDMKYYNLYGSDDLRLAFKSDDGTNDIPANEPIACYGSGNFTLTSNSNAVVPADNDSREYNEVVTAISCENIRELVEDGKQMTTENKPWNFKGVRFDSYVYGTEYTETLPNCPNCAKKSLVYYFSKDKFTYVNSKGRVKFAPFRAYLQAPEGSSAKTFSLLVFDEDGATDITEIIDGNAGVANGKIYDLLGRRVKTPLKGHIYIVDGKKKQY